ncbi:hypothetical protein AGMMS49938_07460 [Fibrobacterales bacterium]|nr:hypothetical protein AGMMS49938_07460 [Fibrobacterales bacterium]
MQFASVVLMLIVVLSPVNTVSGAQVQVIAGAGVYVFATLELLAAELEDVLEELEDDEDTLDEDFVADEEELGVNEEELFTKPEELDEAGQNATTVPIKAQVSALSDEQPLGNWQ